ncbi:FGGY family carbohydrate kinase [Megasphaera hominis]|uniref:ATP:glycerol 3-phosphotransferase n=1 Tax=Megasphaera hominis TaxID=159836 RepID=A0ABR6VGW6_9FIRM|nr:glycerol kinase GlpK [Megasphaera hominis]MBC3536534.1 glycerol kinase GlpK [Megasphaera hominis]
MKKYYMGIDQGTTGTRTLLFDRAWNVIASGYEALPVISEKKGWAEHQVEDIWRSVLGSTAKAMKAANAETDSILSIGINHEGESVIVWDSRTGEPVYPCIVWQDKRNVREIEEIAWQYNDQVKEKTGLMVDTYFSAAKYAWIMAHVPKAKELMEENRLMAGTLDTWLIWKMSHCRVYVTEPSTASRTLLYNVKEKKWDDELAEIFGLQADVLPEICNSAQIYGETDPLDFLGIQAPIAGILVDQQAALIGQGCIHPGMIKTTYGTGCFMLMNTGNVCVDSQYGLLPTVAWQVNGNTTYALDGGVYTTGAATKWLSDSLQIMESPKDSEALAKSIPDNGGLYFVPAFNGLAAPHWDSYASGMMIGINTHTTRAHVVRAALEATAYQVNDVLASMAGDTSIPITVMRCNGAATQNSFLMQFQSDILGIPLELPVIEESTAFGAAFMGAVGIGDYDSLQAIEEFWQVRKVYEPSMPADERDALVYEWHRSVQRAKFWIET